MYLFEEIEVTNLLFILSALNQIYTYFAIFN